MRKNRVLRNVVESEVWNQIPDPVTLDYETGEKQGFGERQVIYDIRAKMNQVTRKIHQLISDIEEAKKDLDKISASCSDCCYTIIGNLQEVIDKCQKDVPTAIKEAYGLIEEETPEEYKARLDTLISQHESSLEGLYRLRSIIEK